MPTSSPSQAGSPRHWEPQHFGFKKGQTPAPEDLGFAEQSQVPWLRDDFQPKGFYDLQLSQHRGRAGASSWEELSRFPSAQAGSSGG